MKARGMATAALLAFVAVCIVTIAIRGMRDTRREAPEAIAAPAPSGLTVVVYYFHGSVRCASCNLIESMAKEALERRFPEALKDGRLEWRTVDFDEPANAHFKKDFSLAANSLVAVATENGRQVKWENLEKIWEYLDEKDKFVPYVQERVGAFLREE